MNTISQERTVARQRDNHVKKSSETPLEVSKMFRRNKKEKCGHSSLLHLQRFGGLHFSAAVSFMAAASKLVAQGSLQLNSHTVAFEQVGSPVTHIIVYRISPLHFGRVSAYCPLAEWQRQPH